MYTKCLFKPLASAILLVGLSACDEGRIPDSYLTEMPAAAEDLTLMDAVQRQVFDLRCTQCHGGSSHAAAGLYLTPRPGRGAPPGNGRRTGTADKLKTLSKK